MSSDNLIYFALIPGVKPFSLNHAYVNVRGAGRVVKAEARRWRDDLFYLAAKTAKPNRALMDKYSRVLMGKYSLLALDLIFYAPEDYWFTKEGEPKKKDVSNMIKLAEDTICSYIGFDDKYVFDVRSRKGIGPHALQVEVRGLKHMDIAMSEMETVERKEKR